MDNDQSRFTQTWPAGQTAAINDAVKGRTVEGLEIHDARSVLITFAGGLSILPLGLRPRCVPEESSIAYITAERKNAQE
jgi:hypothetical protein